MTVSLIVAFALAAALPADDAAETKCIVTYTFDDGLADQYEIAYPMFKETGLPATFFIIGSKVGDPKGMRSKVEKHTPVMTWEMIRDMAANGMEIASHGWAHAKYQQMDREAILEDIRKNQNALKENAGVDCVSFASPYNAKRGKDGTDILALVKEEGLAGCRPYQKAAGGGATAESLNAKVEEAKKKGEWLIFMTHGMARGYDAWQNPEELRKHLKWVKEQEGVKVLPFGEAVKLAETLKAKRAASTGVGASEDGFKASSREREKGWWLPRHKAKVAEIKGAAPDYDLVFIGDSITDFWSNERSGGGKVLKEKFGKWRILNLGVMGDRIDNMMWRLENGEGEGWKAKAIMLLCGTNDIGKKRGGEDVAARTKWLLGYIREKHPEAKVVLLPIFPRNDKKRGADAEERIAKANELTALLADGKNVIRLDFTKKFLNEDGTLNESLFKDALHPNRAGYEIWAEAAIPLFEQLLAQ